MRQPLFWRRLILLVSWVLFMVMLLPLLVHPHQAFAQSIDRVAPDKASLGMVVTVTGSRWTAGDTIAITLASGGSTVLVRTTVASNGTFTARFTVPSNAITTLQFINVLDETEDINTQAPFEVKHGIRPDDLIPTLSPLPSPS